MARKVCYSLLNRTGPLDVGLLYKGMLMHVVYTFEIWHIKIIGQQQQILAAKFKDLKMNMVK